MKLLTDILVSLLGIAGGAAVLRWSRHVTMFFGKFDWAEKWLGSGGTHTAIRIFGAALVFIFILYPFGYWDGWLKRDAPAEPAPLSAPAEPAHN